MSLLSALILGLIQGVSEFLPISSSGHLSIAQNLLGLTVEGSEDMFFEVLLHLGTLVAVFVAYWRDIREMVLEFGRTITDIARSRTPERVPPARRLILLLIIATLPLFLVLPLKDWIESLGSNTYVVGAALLVTGLLLFLSDRSRRGRKTERNATLGDVLMVGIGQAVATCPGLSRSGTTISLGCFVGMDRRFAVRFAFLLSIPAVLGANILKIFDVVQTGIDPKLIPAYLLGVIVAAGSGYLCIRLVHRIADKGKFGGFAYYCWIVGGITLLLSLLKSGDLLPWLK